MGKIYVSIKIDSIGSEGRFGQFDSGSDDIDSLRKVPRLLGHDCAYVLRAIDAAGLTCTDSFAEMTLCEALLTAIENGDESEQSGRFEALYEELKKVLHGAA